MYFCGKEWYWISWCRIWKIKKMHLDHESYRLWIECYRSTYYVQVNEFFILGWRQCKDVWCWWWGNGSCKCDKGKCMSCHYSPTIHYSRKMTSLACTVPFLAWANWGLDLWLCLQCPPVIVAGWNAFFVAFHRLTACTWCVLYFGSLTPSSSPTALFCQLVNTSLLGHLSFFPSSENHRWFFSWKC